MPKLTGGEIGVKMRRVTCWPVTARLFPSVDQRLELTAADFNECKFGGDEKAV